MLPMVGYYTVLAKGLPVRIGIHSVWVKSRTNKKWAPPARKAPIFVPQAEEANVLRGAKDNPR